MQIAKIASAVMCVAAAYHCVRQMMLFPQDTVDNCAEWGKLATTNQVGQHTVQIAALSSNSYEVLEPGCQCDGFLIPGAWTCVVTLVFVGAVLDRL